MIDDDAFQKLFRELMEQFFGKIGIGPNRSTIGGPDSGVQENPVGPNFVEADSEELPYVERFDFDDYVLLVVQGCGAESEITVRTKGNLVILNLASGTELLFEMPFVVDAEESSISCRNGIAEITIWKNVTEDHDNNERILGFE